MPKGLSKIRQINEENAARKAAYESGGGGFRYLDIKPNTTVKVRFLQQGEDVDFIWIHDLPKQPGDRFPKKTPCLDQDDTGVACAACERGIKRRSQVVVPVIWYGAPKFVRDNQGKIMKQGDSPVIDPSDPIEDTVAVWKTGPTNGGTLEHLDSQYGGLMNWIWLIKRIGSGKDDTQYFIDPFEPAAGPKPPTPEDIQLAQNKPKDPYVVVPKLSYGDMARIYSGGATAQPAAQPAPDGASNNAFAQAAAGPINRGAFS